MGCKLQVGVAENPPSERSARGISAMGGGAEISRCRTQNEKELICLASAGVGGLFLFVWRVST